MQDKSEYHDYVVDVRKVMKKITKVRAIGSYDAGTIAGVSIRRVGGKRGRPRKERKA